MSWYGEGADRLYVEESGGGEPLLFLPGFSESAARHAALRDWLAQRYHVIAVDLPGSGRSGPQPRDYVGGFYRDDAETLSALLRSRADRPARLVGFSDGGEVVLLIAALHPELVRSAVTWGAAGFVADPDGQLRAMLHDIVDRPIPPTRGFRDYLVATYGESTARATTQSYARALTAIVDAGGDISRSLADKIACPVLLINGEHDIFAPPTLAEAFARPPRRHETITVPGAGHDVHITHPDRFTTTVGEWLARH